MSEVISTEVVTCPYCGAKGTIRIYSCGCQGISHSEHTRDCNRKARTGTEAFFDAFERTCSQHR
jgi:hypothetical protein